MFPGIGIIANVAAIALGGILGLGCGRFIAERVQETLMRACALAVMFLGLGGTLRTMLSANADGQLALDGVIIMLLTATLGKGCIFSSVSVGLFQGAIFALAGLLAPYMTDSALAGLSCVGNILIFAIGTNLLGLPNIRVANFLPALVIAALWGMG